MVKHPYKKVFIAFQAAYFCLSLSLPLTPTGWAQSPVELKTPTTVPTLVNALKDQDWRVRSQAAQRLGQMGATAADAIPALIKRLDDEDVVVRLRAALALGQIGKPAIPALIVALKDQDEKVRYNATYALGLIGSGAKETIPALINTLKDQDETVRQGAILGLAQMGSLILPTLTEALQTRDERVRNGAISALGKISDQLQDKGKTLPLAELNKVISDLEQATGILTAPNLKDELSGTPKRFSDEAIAPVRRTLDALKTERSNRILIAAFKIIFLVLVLLSALGLALLWLRPLLLLRLSRAMIAARQEREISKQALTTTQRFLGQAGATVTWEGKRGLRIVAASGRLKSFAPLPVVLAIDKPTAQDVTELVHHAQRLGGDRQKRAGVLLYHQPPDTMFRVRMAEVRLCDQFVLIPIPLVAIEQAVSDSATCAGLLAQYTDRYLPGADLFDDRNAIGDTLSFFGRSELLHRLEEELLRKQGVGLFGIRKSGKTSILLQLGFSLRQHPVVHIDLQPYGGKPYYGAELFNEILRQLSLLVSDRDLTLLPHFEPFTPNHPATELTTYFTQRLNGLVEVLKKIDYKLPILCFLDEVERILPIPTDPPEKVAEFNACFGVLRALNQEQQKLGFLVADVHPDCNRINQWQQPGVPTNPVFNFFKEVFLSPFSEEETTTMLADIGQLMGREFDSETLATIHKESGGHPFVARQLASLLCARIPEQGDGLITWSAAQRYINRPFTYSSVLKDYFGQNIWADLKKRNFESAMAVLRGLACNQESVHGLTEQDLQQLLDSEFTESQRIDALLWLEMVGLVVRVEVEDNDCYRSKVPLLLRWLEMEMGEEESRKWQIH